MSLYLLAETAKQTEKIPEVLPILLGFLIALGLLNLGLSLVRKKAAKENKKLTQNEKHNDPRA